MKNIKSSTILLATVMGLLGVTIFSIVLFSGTMTAEAKGVFGLGKKTAVATSSLTYMTPGAATTTLTYDTYTDGLTTADSMALMVRLNATTSPSATLNIYQEFSQDGIDWYQNTQPNIIQNATTTIQVDASMVPFYSWKSASSTQPTLGGVAASSNNSTRIIVVKSPTRFTRFVFVMTGASASIWAQILPVKQNP